MMMKPEESNKDNKESNEENKESEDVSNWDEKEVE